MSTDKNRLLIVLTVFLSSVFSLSMTHGVFAEEKINKEISEKTDENNTENDTSTKNSKTAQDEQLATLTAQQASLPKIMKLDGQVESVQKATISAQTSGTIEQLFYDVDDFVKKGSVIARIRAKNQKAGLEQAKAQLEQSKANISEAKARQKEANAEYERIKKVYDRQLISRSQYDNAQAAKEAASARLEAANAALKAAEANVSRAGEQLGYTEIRAPYSGLVTARLVEQGESVNVGTPLMSGISLDKLRVVFMMPQSQVNAARDYNQAAVFLDKKKIAVKRLIFFPYADAATNAFRVRAELKKTKVDLYPGMFVKVAVTVGETKQLTIPESAVAYRSEVTGVYVIDDENKPRLRQVRLGRKSDDGKIQILAGLNDGEKIAQNPTEAAVYFKRLMEQQAAQAAGDHHE